MMINWRLEREPEHDPEREAPRCKPQAILAEPSEAKDASPPYGKPQVSWRRRVNTDDSPAAYGGRAKPFLASLSLCPPSHTYGKSKNDSGVCYGGHATVFRRHRTIWIGHYRNAVVWAAAVDGRKVLDRG